jgi:uncharacterized membrane protein YhhN
MLPFDGGATGTANGTLIFAVLLAIGYLFYGQRRTSPVKVVAKTASVGLLALLSLLEGGPWLLTTALAFCATGDFFLAIEDRDERFFLAGLAAFLIGHLAYVALFFALPVSPEPLPVIAKVAIGAAMLTISGGMALRLWRAAGDLRIAVMVYIAAILAMGMAAMSNGNGMIIAGAASFMVSDTILAAERFLLTDGAPGRQFASPVVWITYFAAQVLILFGVLLG